MSRIVYRSTNRLMRNMNRLMSRIVYRSTNRLMRNINRLMSYIVFRSLRCYHRVRCFCKLRYRTHTNLRRSANIHFRNLCLRHRLCYCFANRHFNINSFCLNCAFNGAFYGLTQKTSGLRSHLFRCFYSLISNHLGTGNLCPVHNLTIFHKNQPFQFYIS